MPEVSYVLPFLRSFCARGAHESDRIPVGLYVESAMCAGYPKESRKPEIYAICIVTLCLAIPIVIGRCIARYRLTSRLWPDDYMSVVATVGGPVLYRVSRGE